MKRNLNESDWKNRQSYYKSFSELLIKNLSKKISNLGKEIRLFLVCYKLRNIKKKK